MSTISGQYSTVPLYPLYQAGQGSPVLGQNGSTPGHTSTNLPQSTATQPPGSLENAQNSQDSLQSNQGGQTDSTNSPSSALPPSTYSSPGASSGSAENPNASFINNQEAAADYQSMVLNLGQGNIAAAAKDYAQLQTDLNLHGQHHSGGSVAIDTNSADSTGGSVFSVTV